MYVAWKTSGKNQLAQRLMNIAPVARVLPCLNSSVSAVSRRARWRRVIAAMATGQARITAGSRGQAAQRNRLTICSYSATGRKEGRKPGYSRAILRVSISSAFNEDVARRSRQADAST